MPHTKKWYRKEHTFHSVIDRDTYDYWVSLGEKSIAQRAAEEVDNLLEKNAPALLDQDKQTELNEIMLADAKINGVEQLPEMPD